MRMNLVSKQHCWMAFLVCCHKEINKDARYWCCSLPTGITGYMALSPYTGLYYLRWRSSLKMMRLRWMALSSLLIGASSPSSNQLGYNQRCWSWWLKVFRYVSRWSAYFYHWNCFPYYISAVLFTIRKCKILDIV